MCDLGINKYEFLMWMKNSGIVDSDQLGGIRYVNDNNDFSNYDKDHTQNLFNIK